MPKLASTYRHTALPQGPTSTVNPRYTHEAGVGYGKDARTELFTLAVTNFVSEDAFYESGKARDARFEMLVQACAAEHPEWTAGLISWLRAEANMRTASIVAAVEYVCSGAPNGRQVIAGACQRADEPAEALAYWMGRHGRKLPYALKRGVADAAVRLYNERSAVKWDSSSSPMRFGDVIDLTHPKPKAGWQASLFKYLLDVRHGRDNPRGLEELADLAAFLEWRTAPDLTSLPTLATWENVSSHIKPDAAFWEALIPQMGYMALLRNLRNFEEAGVSAAASTFVADLLADLEQVANSRQLPFRFWSAWKHSGTMTFGPALEKALDLSVGNIPEFPGRTLVMVDTSGSMQGARMSARSKLTAVEAAGLFGAAVVARSSKESTLGIYADGAGLIERQRSVLRTAELIHGSIGRVGHGTQTWPSTRHVWESQGPFDRVLVFTDMQDHPGHGATFVPPHVPVYVWDLGGYKTTNLELGSGRYLLGGLSDQAFKLVHLLERGTAAGWPWE